MGLNPGTVYWMDVLDASYFIIIHEIKKNKVTNRSTHKKKNYYPGFKIPPPPQPTLSNLTPLKKLSKPNLQTTKLDFDYRTS
jgi:hypothetical protein